MSKKQTQSKALKLYVVSGTYTKSNSNGIRVINILNTFDGATQEEAIGKAITKWGSEYKDYALLFPPLTICVAG